MISAHEIRSGVVEVKIFVEHYGDVGQHWRRVLEGPNHNGYGKIYIQRYGANKRRYWHCYGPRSFYKGEKGNNMDECPGAMFIWPNSLKDASVEGVDAIYNQKLGRDMGAALRKYEQKDEYDLWQIIFRFM